MRKTTLRRPTQAAVALLLSSGLLLAGTSGASALDLGSISGSFGSLGLGQGPEIEQPPATPRLTSIGNFRDVAGDGEGYTTKQGKHLKRGVFYRANALHHASSDDLATLAGLGVTKVYDFRSEYEKTDPQVGGAPNKLPAGATGVNAPIDFGNLAAIAMGFDNPDDSRRFMEQANIEFVTDAAKRQQFAKVLTDLANSTDPQIFNCTSGKDRTGWTAMLLQSIAGMSDKDIMADYLISNERLEATNARTIAGIKASMPGADGERLAANITPMLGVEASFLQAGLDKIRDTHFSVYGYLADGLGLSSQTINKLRDKLVA